MPTSIKIRSFSGGAWSRNLWQRDDLSKYQSACQIMHNFIPLPFGGAENRTGFQYIGDTKLSTTRGARVVPFIFSVVQAYVLEFGHQYIRFYANDGIVQSSKTITNAVNNGSGLIRLTSNSHGFSNGWTVTVTGVGGVPNANGTWIISGVTANTFDLVGSTFAGAYTSGGTAVGIVEVATTYQEADLFLLKFEQSADVLYITHPSYAPAKLSRNSSVSWTLANVVYGASIAPPTGLSTTVPGAISYTVSSLNAAGEESIGATPVLSTNTATLNWVAAVGAVKYNIYESVNGLYGFKGQAVGVTSFVLTAAVADLTKSVPTYQNYFGSTNNYPGCSAFFQQRLFYGRTNNAPQTVWASSTGFFDNFNISSPIEDDDACIFPINDNQVNEVKNITPLTGNAIIFTGGGEFRMNGYNDSAITPTNVKIQRQSTWGSSDVKPQVVGPSVIFVDRSGRRVRDAVFNIQLEAYDGNELSIFNQDLFDEGTIQEMCFQQYPNPVLWMATTDGRLIGLSYNRNQEILAWHEHDTPNGLIQSVCTLPASDGGVDLYLVIQRTINATTRHYIEKLHRRDFTSITNAFFVDCGLMYNSTPATTISGLSHLEGETVSALADGNVVEDLVVTGGSITLPKAASVVSVGLPYISELKPMAFAIDTQNGPLSDKTRQVPSVLVRLKDTRALAAGPDEDSTNYEIQFRDTEDWDESTQLFNGVKEVFIDSSQANRQGTAYFVVNYPVPCTVLDVTARIAYGER